MARHLPTCQPPSPRCSGLGRCLDRLLSCLRYKDLDGMLWIWVNDLKTQWQASVCQQSVEKFCSLS